MSDYEHKLLSAIPSALASRLSTVVVDSTRSIEEGGDRVFVVRCHLVGDSAGHVGYTFPFVESVPLEVNLAAFRDFISRSHEKAEEPPPIAASEPARA